MLRAANLPRGPQDETTADIEVHLYGARTGQSFEPWGPYVELNRHRFRDRDEELSPSGDRMIIE